MSRRRDGPNTPLNKTDAADASCRIRIRECGRAEHVQILSLSQASRRLPQQPAVAVFNLEGVEQAGAEKTSPSLRSCPGGGWYSVGGFDVNAGGLSVIPGTPPGSRYSRPRSVRSGWTSTRGTSWPT